MECESDGSDLWFDGEDLLADQLEDISCVVRD